MMNRVSNGKAKQFPVNSPLVIQIVQRPSGDWTIQPAPNYQKQMKDRVTEDDGGGKVLKDRILQEWSHRNPKKSEPEFLSDPEHIPIMLREGEFVQIVCESGEAFDVWVVRNPDVDAVAGTPADLFGWNGERSVVAGGSVTASVIMPPVNGNGDPTQLGPRDQGFYKFRARVYRGGATISVDPDGYCDR